MRTKEKRRRQTCAQYLLLSVSSTGTGEETTGESRRPRQKPGTPIRRTPQEKAHKSGHRRESQKNDEARRAGAGAFFPKREAWFPLTGASTPSPSYRSPPTGRKKNENRSASALRRRARFFKEPPSAHGDWNFLNRAARPKMQRRFPPLFFFFYERHSVRHVRDAINKSEPFDNIDLSAASLARACLLACFHASFPRKFPTILCKESGRETAGCSKFAVHFEVSFGTSKLKQVTRSSVKFLH